MDVPNAVVVGAGIGGLTAAAALHRAGWAVTLLERAPALEPVGAGIALAPNAQRALDTLGAGDRVRAMARFQGAGSLRLPSGRTLSTTTGEEAATRFGGPVVVAHRADVVALLSGLLPRGALRTGVPVTAVDPGDADRRASVTTPEGEVEADLVVAADGVRSAVRAALFPGHPGPRPTGLTSWRAVVPAPDLPYEPHETWGRGLLWGTVPLADGRVYCYATAVAPPGERAPDERALLQRLFGGWHQPVPALIAAITPDRILRTDIWSMPVPLPAHHRGRVALLGDAAHAMAPNLGQGGCQAVEDAVVLARLARPDRDLPAALAAYTAERLPRTAQVVRRSEQISRLTAWRSRPAVALRDGMVAALGRLAPQLALRSLDGIADWRPPAR